jgi:hypothetical protein
VKETPDDDKIKSIDLHPFYYTNQVRFEFSNNHRNLVHRAACTKVGVIYKYNRY